MYKKKITNHYIEFAAKWKQKFSPESVAEGKRIARTTAINKDSVSKGIYPMAQGYKDLEQGINDGQALSNKGRQTMATKAASSNRTMRPTRQRGTLRAAPAKNQLSSKSANSFKQGAQNQAINAKNTRLRNASKAFDNNVKLRMDLDDALNPTPKITPTPNKPAPLNAPKVNGNVLAKPKLPNRNLLQKVGQFANRNKGKGLALAGVGALGYALKKRQDSKR